MIKVSRKVINVGGRPKRLTEEQIDIMVEHYNRGDTQPELAKQFGVSLSTVQAYLRERR